MAAGDPVTDLSDLINLATGGGSGSPEAVNWFKRDKIAGAAGGTFVAGGMVSLWRYDSQPGAATSVPTTAVVTNNATDGAWKQATSASGAKKRLLSLSAMSLNSGTLILYDRLVQSGGLSGTATGAQTTNLPTAALTRRTSGIGVEAWLEIYTAIGSSSTTISLSYTDDQGNTGNASQSVTWGNTGFKEQDRLTLMPLASGDRGVKAVASVTAAATTSTVGNFGVTLAYPLLALKLGSYVGSTTLYQSNLWSGITIAGGPLDLGATSDACLALAWIPIDTNVPLLMGQAFFLEK